MAPNVNRRQERARRALETVNKAIPDILRVSPRARHAIHKAELVVDPRASTSNGTTPTTATFQYNGPKIRLQCNDTLAAAAKLSDRPFSSKRMAPTLKTSRQKPNVVVLNMASPLKPGGGFLEGANSQEEFLCARTTLYPSLWDSFYRLPELGGVWTPDVLVFRDSSPEAAEMAKRDRYFVDVISAGMFRFPDTNRSRSDEQLETKCSCGVSYCDRDRDIVVRKMKSVLRIAQAKGAEKLVLGAWGCGAYGNPVKEIAKLWRKVIAGGARQRRPNNENWNTIREIVFAIPDRSMLREFQHAFRDVLATNLQSPPSGESDYADSGAPDTANSTSQDQDIATLIDRIQETELQVEQMTNARSRARLRDVLAGLNCELAQKQYKDHDDLTHTSDEDDVIMIGSDGEENSMYNFDENDIASSSDSCCEPTEYFEFRLASKTSPMHDEDNPAVDVDEAMFGSGDSPPSLHPSPRFDASTGWFAGSIDDFQRSLRSNAGQLGGRASHTSPVLRPDSSSGPVIDEFVLEEYLGRYEGTDVSVVKD
ncbi:hypothetical protein LTR08_000283 [Meristemomyces frigidus]|nr:hypothetical protein LTR08_000283 [Meristemomyces frigidus]